MTAACIHHWVIEVSFGLEQEGVCRNCGAVRLFRPYAEEMLPPKLRHTQTVQSRKSEAATWVDGPVLRARGRK